jgi:hypothetical protein
LLPSTQAVTPAARIAMNHRRFMSVDSIPGKPCITGSAQSSGG